MWKAHILACIDGILCNGNVTLALFSFIVCELRWSKYSSCYIYPIAISTFFGVEGYRPLDVAEIFKLGYHTRGLPMYSRFDTVNDQYH